MGIILQKRVKIKDGLGVNISKSGVSPSYRTSLGTIGAKGYSIRSGIPGLYYRQRFGKKSGEGMAYVFLGLIILFFVLLFYIIIFLAILAVGYFIYLIGKHTIIYLRERKKETRMNFITRCVVRIEKMFKRKK